MSMAFIMQRILWRFNFGWIWRKKPTHIYKKHKQNV